VPDSELLAHLYHVVTQAPLVIWAMDREGVFSLTEGTGLSSLGLQRGELVGRSVDEVYSEVPELLDNVRRALSGEQVAALVQIGGLVFDSQCAPIRADNGEISGAVGVAIDVTALHLAKQDVEAFTLFPDENPEPVLRLSKAGEILYANEASLVLREKCGCAGEHVPVRWRRLARRALASGSVLDEEMEVGDRTYLVSVSPIVDKEYVNIYAHDITERKRAQEDKEKFGVAVDSASDWVLITDAEGVIEHVNRAVERITGFSKEELIGKRPGLWKSELLDEAFYEKMAKELRSGQPFSGVFVNRRGDGSLFYLDQTITPLKDEQGKVVRFISTAKDITGQRKLQEKLNRLANYDPLTDLPNRTLFMERLEQAAIMGGQAGEEFAVLSVDIDRFGVVNSQYGSKVGDLVLRELADRLSREASGADTVARLGNDDFAIIMPGTGDTAEITHRLEDLLRRATTPFVLDEHEVRITLSVGVATYPACSRDAQELIAGAALAMSDAGRSGGNAYRFFSDEMNEEAWDFAALSVHLARAIEKDEFVLYYQPYFDTATEELRGMEALIRWNSEEHGVVSPARFIPVLEKTGMIDKVGNWVLDTACRQMKQWQEAGYNLVPVSVNVSARRFRRTSLADQLGDTLARCGLAASYVTVEVTESSFMEDIENTSSILERIREMGIRVAIDDFGTGYSSLAYLMRLPIDTLKIDVSFIRKVTTDPDTAQLVSAIIGVAHNLSMSVIAEGVETEEQLRFLRLLKCDMTQGYYFSRPVPAEEMHGFFAKGSP
jgi:diguanylate cyclase (GGDEF)-like protein/PAS domain S-box-containing protein